MKPTLSNLLDQISHAPLRTKVTAFASLLAFVAVLAIGGVVVNRPHFVKLYANLGDGERVAVEKALAGAKVSYRVSDFPGPFVVWVDESRYDDAQIAVALASGLAQAPRGIDAGSTGASTIFLSAGERAQSMQKREWQECEHLLQKLDFVASATVTTSMPESSPLRPKKPVMVSVALDVRGTTLLSNSQAQTVARLVCNRFGVPPENVVITDQTGHMLYDAAAGDDPAARGRDLFENVATHDRELAAKANEQIAAAFGKRKALVTVTSQWNYDQTTTVDEKIDPKTVVMSTDLRKTSTPQATSDAAAGSVAVGGPAGVSSNVAPEVDLARKAADSSVKPESIATTQDEKKVFEASRSKTQTVHSMPKLERLFVSLVVDESLGAKKAEIQSLVEAAVGFDKTRRDVIGVSTTTFAADAPLDSSSPTEAAKPKEGPSETTRMLLERGVQIVSAIGFLVVLVLSLKGGKKFVPSAKSAGASAQKAGEPEPIAEVEIDPEALARAQIEELVHSDPRRVGEILSRWVDDRPLAGTRR